MHRRSGNRSFTREAHTERHNQAAGDLVIRLQWRISEAFAVLQGWEASGANDTSESAQDCDVIVIFMQNLVLVSAPLPALVQ